MLFVLPALVSVGSSVLGGLAISAVTAATVAKESEARAFEAGVKELRKRYPHASEAKLGALYTMLMEMETGVR